VCAHLQARDAAVVLYERLAPWRDQLAFGSGVQGSVALYLGLLATISTATTPPRPTSPKPMPCTSASARPTGWPSPVSSGRRCCCAVTARATATVRVRMLEAGAGDGARVRIRRRRAPSRAAAHAAFGVSHRPGRCPGLTDCALSGLGSTDERRNGFGHKGHRLPRDLQTRATLRAANGWTLSRLHGGSAPDFSAHPGPRAAAAVQASRRQAPPRRALSLTS